jgi:hypothetical protein
VHLASRERARGNQQLPPAASCGSMATSVPSWAPDTRRQTQPPLLVQRADLLRPFVVVVAVSPTFDDVYDNDNDNDNDNDSESNRYRDRRVGALASNPRSKGSPESDFDMLTREATKGPSVSGLLRQPDAMRTA